MSTHTTSRHFIIPILKVLESCGGSAKTKDIKSKLLQEMDGQLTERECSDRSIDRSRPSSVEPLWWNRARHAAETMREERKGLLEKSKARSIWQITEKGRNELILNSNSMNLLVIPILKHEDAASSVSDEYNPNFSQTEP
jgi:Mrr N-terminal domain